MVILLGTQKLQIYSSTIIDTLYNAYFEKWNIRIRLNEHLKPVSLLFCYDPTGKFSPAHTILSDTKLLKNQVDITNSYFGTEQFFNICV